ncbi:condensation domain-containing protein, partial [Paenibacillus sp. YSY-4.3]
IQKRLYTLSQLEGAETTYNMPGVFKLEGKMDFDRFVAAMNQIIERHDSLRTSFLWQNGELMQRIEEQIEFKVSYWETNVNSKIKAIIEDLVHPFDLSKAPLLRVGLIKMSEEEYVLLFDMHHIISDGVSMTVFVEEFMDLYEGKPLSPIRLQYKDVAVWQQSYRNTEAYKEHEEFWLKTFEKKLPESGLRTDFSRPLIQSFEGGKVDYVLDEQMLAKIKQFGRESGATLYMILLAAYNILLSKLTGQEDIVVGSTVAGRNHADIQRTVGVFINTLALRNEPAGDKDAAAFLMEVKENTLKAYEHQEYPFDELVEKLGIQRDISRNPLFEAMLVLHNHRENEIIEYESFKISPYFEDYGYRVAKIDLTLVANEELGTLWLTLEYLSQLFKRETAEQLMKYYVRILEAIVDQPEMKIKDISILNKNERKTLLSKIKSNQNLVIADFDL